MLNRKFFGSWIVASVAMFAMSYVWHGVVLNDFAKLNYPINVFLLLAGIIYLVIGMVLAGCVSYLLPKMKLFLKGLLFGAGMGVFLYLVAFLLGVSFYSSPQLEHFAVDLLWQIGEQSVGGFMASVAYVFMSRSQHVRTN